MLSQFVFEDKMTRFDELFLSVFAKRSYLLDGKEIFKLKSPLLYSYLSILSHCIDREVSLQTSYNSSVNGRIRLGASCFTILSVKHYLLQKKCFMFRIVRHEMPRASRFLA